MQIRKRGKRTEFLRATYNKETQSSPAKLVGSQESFLHHLESGLAEKMKLESHELEQIEAYFAEKKETHNAVMSKMAVRDVVPSIKEATNAIASGQEVKEDQAIAMYQAMDELAKQLKRSSFPKSVVLPKKRKNVSLPSDDRQSDAFAKSG